MKTLYVTSVEAFSGKTALCLGIGDHLRRNGYRVGYLKPISTTARQIGEQIVDEDAAFIRTALDLPDPLEAIAPIALTTRQIDRILRGEKEADLTARLRDAYRRIAQEKDIVLLEGGAHPLEGSLLGLSAMDVADLLNARELVVIKFESELSIDTAAGLRQLYGDSLLGVVINAVPRQRMRFVEEIARPHLEELGIPVLAVLPQERLLLAISVGELAEILNGEVLCCPDRTNELVEYLMVGAMSVDSALTYFRRKPNKAVITGGDRPDIQLAALETSTKCIILTGNLRPSPIILGRAEEVGVPMILVKQDTLSAVEVIERYFGKTRLHQERKIARFEEMLDERFNYERLYQLLNLT